MGASHYLHEGSSSENNCMFTRILSQVKEAYPEANFQGLDEKKLRNLTADLIEKDPEIRNSITSGWHQYTLESGLYGGASQFIRTSDSIGRAGPHKQVRQYSKEETIEADHQLSVSMLKKYAKDDWVKDLKPGNLPAMCIPAH